MNLLHASSVQIIPNLTVRIPTVEEILGQEETYFQIVSAFTSTPFQYMIPLDDMGIDYTKITEYELFQMLFPVYAQSDLSILFGDVDLSDFSIYIRETDKETILFSPKNNIAIDEPVYHKLADTIRSIHLIEKVKSKPGNESARTYLLEKEPARQKRAARKPHSSHLEKLVVALVNTSEFPYDYRSCMELPIYQFYQSFQQIQHKIQFDHTMTGVYAGTVDTSRMHNKDALSWISNK